VPSPRLKLLNKPTKHFGLLAAIAEDHLQYLRRFVLKRQLVLVDRIETKWGSIDFLVRRSGEDEALIRFVAVNKLIYRPAPSFFAGHLGFVSWYGYDAKNQKYSNEVIAIPAISPPPFTFFTLWRLVYADGYLFAGDNVATLIFRYTGFEWKLLESPETPVSSTAHGFFGLIEGSDGQVYAVEQDNLGPGTVYRIVKWDESTDQLAPITTYDPTIIAITPAGSPFTVFTAGDTTNDPPPDLNSVASFRATYYVPGLGHLFGVFDRATIEADEIELLSEFWNFGYSIQTAPNEFAIGPVLDRPSGSDARWLHKYGPSLVGTGAFVNQASNYAGEFICSAFVPTDDDPYLGAGQEIIISTDGTNITHLRHVKDIENQTPESTDRFFIAESIQRTFDWLIIPDKLVDNEDFDHGWTGVPDNCDVKELVISQSVFGDEIVVILNSTEIRVASFDNKAATARAIVAALNDASAPSLFGVFAGHGETSNTIRVAALLATTTFSMSAHVEGENGTEIEAVVSVSDTFPVIYVSDVFSRGTVTHMLKAETVPPLIYPDLVAVQATAGEFFSTTISLNEVSDPATRWDLLDPTHNAILTPAANNRSAVFTWENPDETRTFRIYVSNEGGFDVASLQVEVP